MKFLATRALALGLTLALGAGCDDDETGTNIDASVSMDAKAADTAADGGADNADASVPLAVTVLGADLIPSATGLEADLFPPEGNVLPADLFPPQ